MVHNKKKIVFHKFFFFCWGGIMFLAGMVSIKTWVKFISGDFNLFLRSWPLILSFQVREKSSLSVDHSVTRFYSLWKRKRMKFTDSDLSIGLSARFTWLDLVWFICWSLSLLCPWMHQHMRSVPLFFGPSVRWYMIFACVYNFRRFYNFSQFGFYDVEFICWSGGELCFGAGPFP